jgi:hypothetical protein
MEMLDNLIKKYKKPQDDIKEVVYQLNYADKFLIVKGKTLCGSLIIIAGTFDHFRNRNPKFKLHLYKHFYNHFIRNKDSHFTVKILAQVGPKFSQYQLLKKEQEELDKHKYNPQCLNNTDRAYIPDYNPETDMFGWLKRAAVTKFQMWLISKSRQASVKKYRRS